jgi:hypothetical protein
MQQSLKQGPRILAISSSALCVVLGAVVLCYALLGNRQSVGRIAVGGGLILIGIYLVVQTSAKERRQTVTPVKTILAQLPFAVILAIGALALLGGNTWAGVTIVAVAAVADVAFVAVIRLLNKKEQSP